MHCLGTVILLVVLVESEIDEARVFCEEMVRAEDLASLPLLPRAYHGLGTYIERRSQVCSAKENIGQISSAKWIDRGIRTIELMFEGWTWKEVRWMSHRAAGCYRLP